MSVLRNFDKKELATRQQAAEVAFRNRIHGVSSMTDVSRFNPNALLMKGSIEAVLCTSAHAILPTFLEKQAQGYSLHETLDLASVGNTAYEFYVIRPEADVQKDLVVVFKQVEDDYRAEIEACNSSIVEREIEAQVARELRIEQKEREDAEQARRLRIAAEVKAALGAK
jgi:hypothetical protein